MPCPDRLPQENNLPYLAGNVLDQAGYACSLPALIKNWCVGTHS
jgi:hypothetical protein